MKKFAKYFTLFLFASATLMFVWLGYFLIANDAPIARGTVTRGIEYKPGLKLDVYAPTRQVYLLSPVVMYIHGGAWITGSKEGLNFNRFNKAANALRAEGYTIVSIDYTLAQLGKSPFPACIADAADAVTWIERHADTLHLDKHHIGLFGESAGAQIAMMLAYGKPEQFSATYVPRRFDYVLDVYGPSRLEGIYHMPTADSLYALLNRLPVMMKSRLDLALYVFGFDPTKDTARAEQIMETYSPYNYVRAGAPPTLLIQGKQDRIVPVSQSLVLQARLDSLGIENQMHLLDGPDHGFINATPQQMTDIQKWIVEFVTGHYPKV